MNRSCLSLFACLFLFPSLQALGQSGPAPRLSFEENAVVASGLTAGAKAIWLSVEQRIDEAFSRDLVRRFRVASVAADGTARLDLKEPPAARSYWVAVDLQTGAFVLSAPEGSSVLQPRKPSQWLRASGGTGSDEIVDDRPYMIGLVVRPGVGAWTFAGGDGGALDADGASDGLAHFALDRFEPLPGSPEAPARVESADLWFIVDPLKMEVAVHKGGVAQ